jgi:hypothetical protein
MSLESSVHYLSVNSDFNLITRVHATSGDQPQNIQQAQNLQIKGRKLLKIKKFRGALACFEESHQRVPDLKNLVIIGAIHIKLNQCKGAFNAWRSALQMCAGCSNTQEIKSKISRYTRRCASAIELKSRPRAQVEIDGVFVGHTPYQGVLLVGKHRLTLNAVGYDPIRQIRVVHPNKPLKIDIDLTPKGRLLGQQPIKNTTSTRRSSIQPQPQPTAAPSSRDQPRLIPMTSPAALTPTFQVDLNEHIRVDPYVSLRRGLWITSGLLGLGAGATYYYSLSEYKELSTLSALRSVAPNPELRQRANRAEMFHTTSGVMLALSAASLVVNLFFLD